MLSWKKLGNVFNPMISKPKPWMQEYAQCPTPLILNDNILRVYVTCRGQRGEDLQHVSYPGYVDLSRIDLSRVVRLSDNPLMPFGQPGSFDEFGITPTSFVREGDKIYAYYTGWTRMQSVPYTMAIGIAVSRDGGESFTRLGQGPILGPTLCEPFLSSGPIVRRIGGRWHMWYLMGKGWVLSDGKYESVYQISHATSEDGLAWDRNGKTILPARSENECQVSFTPFYLAGRWHALFAFRQATGFRADAARSYRLGYAWSTDLETWERDDSQAGLDVSASGWDAEMMCYPQIGEVDGRVLLFYCGNDFGRNGFGIAELTNHSVS